MANKQIAIDRSIAKQYLVDHSLILFILKIKKTIITETYYFKILTIQNDLILQSKELEDFWKFVNRETYPNITKCNEFINSCFGSTYLCESAFSYLKFTKNKQRSLLTDSHTEDSLKLALSGYTPNYERLVEDMQTQTSH